MANETLTALDGVLVGHSTDLEAATGCTVVLCPPGTVAGVDVSGSAPGTRETDLLGPVSSVKPVNAIVLSGGSAFGLDAATGVVAWLEEHGRGFDVGVAVVPIVPAAVLFDLNIGSPTVRPDRDAGYQACERATSEPVAEGCVGAGTGATVGKLLGPAHATKCGLGSACVTLHGGVKVAALVAVNALGDVVSPTTGQVVAGPRNPDGRGFVRTSERLRGDLAGTVLGPGRNTTIAVVATDATLSRPALSKTARMAHDGLARTIQPVHTMADGDAVFALSTGAAGREVDVSVVGAAAADVLADAVLRAAAAATALAGVPAARDVIR